jgi:hypothetical protein
LRSVGIDRLTPGQDQISALKLLNASGQDLSQSLLVRAVKFRVAQQESFIYAKSQTVTQRRLGPFTAHRNYGALATGLFFDAKTFFDRVFILGIHHAGAFGVDNFASRLVNFDQGNFGDLLN